MVGAVPCHSPSSSSFFGVFFFVNVDGSFSCNSGGGGKFLLDFFVVDGGKGGGPSLAGSLVLLTVSLPCSF